MRLFGAESAASEVLAGVDLRGRRAQVTGGSGGLGEETVVFEDVHFERRPNDKWASVDPAAARLWSVSEAMVGERFEP